MYPNNKPQALKREELRTLWRHDWSRALPKPFARPEPFSRLQLAPRAKCPDSTEPVPILPL